MTLPKKIEEVSNHQLTTDELKEVVKSAISEWLDSKFIAFGKWSIATIGALALAALTYFLLRMHGWERKP